MSRIKMSANERVIIDYPRPDEVIASASYAFRISASKSARAVKVSIDNGPWMDCRQAVGYWWHDWFKSDAGSHEVWARAVSAMGRVTLSDSCRFFCR
ncbi:MAG: hypothetical protein ACYCPQ_05075 [Elusimicrobiota bacterium]